VGRRKISLSNLSSILVSFQRLVGRLLSLVANSKLSKIAMIVTLPTSKSVEEVREGVTMDIHLVVKDLGLSAFGRRDQMLVKDLENIFADLGKLGLNLLAILLNESDLS